MAPIPLGRRACAHVCAVWCLREDEEGSRGFFAGLCLAFPAFTRRRATLKRVQELPGRRGSESGLSRNYQPSSGRGKTSAGMTGGRIDQPANTCAAGRGYAAREEHSARNVRRSRLVTDRRRRRAGKGPASQTDRGRQERERERAICECRTICPSLRVQHGCKLPASQTHTHTCTHTQAGRQSEADGDRCGLTQRFRWMFNFKRPRLF